MPKDLLSGDLPEDFDNVLSDSIPEDFDEVIKSSSFQGNEPTWLLSRLADQFNKSPAAVGFRTGVENISHGVLQPLYESGIFGQRMKEALRNAQAQNTQDYAAASEQAPITTGLGNFLGSVGASLPLEPAIASASTGLASQFGPGLGSTLSGALGGGLYGAAGYASEGESKMNNALQGALTGGILGSIPGVMDALGKAPSAIKENIITPQIGKSKKIYGEIEHGLKSVGKNTDLKLPNIDWKNLAEEIPSRSTKYLPGLKDIKKLSDEGTYESLNKAQSMLSQWKRALEQKSSMGGSVTKSLNAIENAEKRIHGRLYERFMEVDPALTSKYQKANELYAEGMSKNERLSKALKKIGIGGGLIAAGKTVKDAVSALLGGKD